MKSSDLYRITVLNWSERRPKHKTSYKSTMLTNNFTKDGKLNALNFRSRWLYLDFILTCGDHGRDKFTTTLGQVCYTIGTRSVQVAYRLVQTLVEIQLVTAEKIESLELNELNKVNRIEYNSTVVQKTAPTVPAVRPKIVEFESPEILYEQISPLTKETWRQLYNDDSEFLRREIIKAFAWYKNNPKKIPKTVRGWNQCLSSWLERSWKGHVRGIVGEKKTSGVVQP